MIKFNKDNQVFRIAFDEFIEETEERRRMNRFLKSIARGLAEEENQETVNKC